MKTIERAVLKIVTLIVFSSWILYGVWYQFQSDKIEQNSFSPRELEISHLTNRIIEWNENKDNVTTNLYKDNVTTNQFNLETDAIYGTEP